MSLLAFSFVGFVKGLLMFFFVLGSLLLMLIVLLQEPKGGGLSSAFGGAGQDTFGVQTGGVNKFTAWVAGSWIMIAILYAAIKEGPGQSVLDETAAPPAATTENDGGAPDGDSAGPGGDGESGGGAPGDGDTGGGEEEG